MLESEVERPVLNSGQNGLILIVEDDPIVCESLRAVLEHCGYACSVAPNAAVALDHLRNVHPDAVVTDVSLPDCDGIELIAAIRGMSRIPILVVSGRSDEASKIAALDNGADDYIQKPFPPGELLARIRAKLRLRHVLESGAGDELCAFTLDNDLDLSRMERALLALLIKHQGTTISEDRIIRAVWGAPGAANSADVRALVLKLRRKLELQRQPLFILNERGVGYYVSRWGRVPSRTRTDTPRGRQLAMRVAMQGSLQPSADRPASILMMPEKSLPAPPSSAKRS